MSVTVQVSVTLGLLPLRCSSPSSDASLETVCLAGAFAVRRFAVTAIDWFIGRLLACLVV